MRQELSQEKLWSRPDLVGPQLQSFLSNKKQDNLKKKPNREAEIVPKARRGSYRDAGGAYEPSGYIKRRNLDERKRRETRGIEAPIRIQAPPLPSPFRPESPYRSGASPTSGAEAIRRALHNSVKAPVKPPIIPGNIQISKQEKKTKALPKSRTSKLTGKSAGAKKKVKQNIGGGGCASQSRMGDLTDVMTEAVAKYGMSPMLLRQMKPDIKKKDREAARKAAAAVSAAVTQGLQSKEGEDSRNVLNTEASKASEKLTLTTAVSPKLSMPRTDAPARARATAKVDELSRRRET